MERLLGLGRRKNARHRPGCVWAPTLSSRGPWHLAPSSAWESVRGCWLGPGGCVPGGLLSNNNKLGSYHLPSSREPTSPVCLTLWLLSTTSSLSTQLGPKATSLVCPADLCDHQSATFLRSEPGRKVGEGQGPRQRRVRTWRGRARDQTKQESGNLGRRQTKGQQLEKYHPRQSSCPVCLAPREAVCHLCRSQKALLE